MSEERLEHSIALVLARWMGGENLREATEEVVKLARMHYETGTVDEKEVEFAEAVRAELARESKFFWNSRKMQWEANSLQKEW